MLRVGVFYSLYSWLLAQVVEVSGLDIWLSRAITLGFLATLWYFAGHLLVLPWIGERKKRVAILMVATALCLAGMEFATRDVYFSRSDGTPAKYYIRTLDGYEFSATPGTDPVHGIRYQPMTAEVAHQYLLWKKRDGDIKDPSVPEDQYFDPSTGDPVRWYAELPNGQIELFTLPGFHPTYGMKLLPATPEVVTSYQKRKSQAKTKKRERERANYRARVRHGRYVLPWPQPGGSFDDLRFTVREVHLTSVNMMIHLEVTEVRNGTVVASAFSPRVERSRIDFALAREDGKVLQALECRPTHSLLYRRGIVSFPSSEYRGSLVVEFPPLEDRRISFSPTINDCPIFGSINLGEAEFRSF